MSARRIFPAIATISVTAIAPGALCAQGAGVPDHIAECRSMSDDASSQIACLEAAIVELTSPDAGVETTQASLEPTPDAVMGLGAEQVLSRRRTENRDEGNDQLEEEVAAAVTEFAQTPSGAYVFFLDNGQVWRQKRADSNRIHLSGKRTYTATVSAGAISGYRLKIHELRRTLLVERIR